MIETPLEILSLQEDGFHLLVEVVVFGQTFKAVIDTGASKTVFDKSTVMQYIDPEILLLSDKVSTGLGTNSMESFLLKIPRLLIGPLLIADMQIAVLDLSIINETYQKLELNPIIGVIGGDILMQYGAVIDYAAQKLYFKNLI